METNREKEIIVVHEGQQTSVVQLIRNKERRRFEKFFARLDLQLVKIDSMLITEYLLRLIRNMKKNIERI